MSMMIQSVGSKKNGHSVEIKTDRVEPKRVTTAQTAKRGGVESPLAAERYSGKRNTVLTRATSHPESGMECGEKRRAIACPRRFLPLETFFGFANHASLQILK